MATVVINSAEAEKKLAAVEKLLADPTPLMRSIAQVLEAETEQNFEAQGRPGWVPLSEATKRERLKRNKGSTVLRILQDRGILAASVSSAYGADFAQVGAGGAASEYAGIHQFGGTITIPPSTRTVRLRTDAKGRLVRQQNNPNLARFAKASGKRARESTVDVDGYTVTIPARPYLPFSGGPENAVLQPEAEASVLDVVTRALDGAFS